MTAGGQVEYTVNGLEELPLLKIAHTSLLIAFVTVELCSGDWPRWRGPDANSVADGSTLPIEWSPTKNIRWSLKLPGWGTSSPVIYRNRLFVTSQAEAGGEKSLLTLCYRDTGQELWRHDFGLGVNPRTNPKSNLAVNTTAVTGDGV